ncbi:MAG TPA: hypothetical protein VEK07_14380 [Polyangiaceae bacterium]|nr:hypothetical protein [Polyangiaceae bacterium]
MRGVREDSDAVGPSTGFSALSLPPPSPSLLRRGPGDLAFALIRKVSGPSSATGCGQVRAVVPDGLFCSELPRPVGSPPLVSPDLLEKRPPSFIPTSSISLVGGALCDEHVLQLNDAQRKVGNSTEVDGGGAATVEERVLDDERGSGDGGGPGLFRRGARARGSESQQFSGAIERFVTRHGKPRHVSMRASTGPGEKNAR